MAEQPYCGTIEVGSEFVNGTRVRVVRVQAHAGTSKVWYRRSDGKNITLGVSETWEYEGEFRMKFSPVEGSEHGG